METFLVLAGWALVLLGFSFVLHGPPNLITINKFYDNSEEEETEN